MDLLMRLRKAVGLILILGLFLMDPCSQSPNSVEGDRQVLMDLYEATGGDNWNNNSGWGNGNPSDAWSGVEVDADGRVVRLDLYNNGLSGELPESIGNLTKVKYLNVKNNNLSGEIPSSIGNMASLEWLILAGRTYEIGGHTKEPPQNLNYGYHPGKYNSATNSFTGSIPSTIGNLSELKRIEISGQGSEFGPGIPDDLYNLTSLEGIYMSRNAGFTGSISPAIGNLTQLAHLYLATNNMGGDLPSSMSNLTNLTMINIGTGPGDNENNFTGSLPDFSGATNLIQVNLDKNSLTGEWPHYWNNGNFTDLITLGASWNDFTGTLHGFENLPNLQSLRLGGLNLSGSIGDQLLTLPAQVQIIALGWNNFTGELPQSGWPDFYQLKTLYINNNSLSGRLSCDFWKKIQNPKLNNVRVNNNNFSSSCQ